MEIKLTEKDIEAHNKGITEYKAKNYYEAIKCFTTSLLETWKLDFVTRTYRGYCYYHIGSFKEALIDFDFVEVHEKTNGNLYRFRGEINKKLEKFENAKKDFYSSIEIEPEHLYSYLELSKILKSEKNWDEALHVINNLIKIKPNYIEAYVIKGNIYEERKNGDDGLLALSQYFKCTKIDPKNYRGYQQMAFYLYERKEFNLALNQFIHCVNLCPNGNFYYHLGMCYKEIGDIENYITEINYSKNLGYVPAAIEIKNNLDLFKIPEKKYILFFDTETTGLPKNWKASYKDVDNWPRIVQLAWQLFDENGNLIESENFIVKPKGFEIPFNSSKIHGISNERANLEGANLETILKEFKQKILGSTLLVAHNMSFDAQVMGSEFYRETSDNPIDKIDKFCTMDQTVNICKISGEYGFKWPKLGELYKHLFSVEFSETHNAMDDVKATSKCYFELKKRKLIIMK